MTATLCLRWLTLVSFVTCPYDPESQASVSATAALAALFALFACWAAYKAERDRSTRLFVWMPDFACFVLLILDPWSRQGLGNMIVLDDFVATAD